MVMGLSLGILLLMVLLEAQQALVATALGMFGAYALYRPIIGPLPHLPYDTAILLLYSLVFTFAIGHFFVGPKTKAFHALLQYQKKFSELQHKNRQQLVETLQYREALLQELTSEAITNLDPVTQAYMQQAIYRMTNYIRLEVEDLPLKTLQAWVALIYSLQLNFRKNTFFIISRLRKE